MNKMKKASTLDVSDTITIRKAASKALTDSGLRDKGVKLNYIPQFKSSMKESPTGFFQEITNYLLGGNLSDKDAKISGIMSQEVKNSSRYKKIQKLITKLDAKKMLPEGVKDGFESGMQLSGKSALLQFKMGSNAAFLPGTNNIMVPEKALNTSVFHEMGHGLNANFGKVSKCLQKMRGPAMAAAGIIGLVALTTKRKVEDTPDENTGKLEKGRHFIKKNAGKLSALAFAPVVAEEAIATIKGNKLAKGVLDSSLLKKVKLTNAMGLATYATAAIATGVATMLAVKAKDSIQSKHEAKVAAKNEKAAKTN